MRKLNVSAITTGVGMPVKSGTLTHIQLAYQEALDALVKNVIGTSYDTSKVYILNGCAVTGTTTKAVTAGAVFYNGEIYLVDAVSITIGSNVLVGNIVTTSYTDGVKADNVTFTDAVARPVHDIRKVVITAAASGSGLADVSDWIDVSDWVKSTLATGLTNNAIVATISSCVWTYKRVGGSVIMNFQVTLSVSSGNTGGGVALTLPVAPREVQGGYFFVACFAGGTAITGTRKSASASIDSSLTKIDLYTDATIANSGSLSFEGQIIYSA